MNIPLCIPNIDKEEIALVEEVLKSGWLAHGPKNKQFEEEFLTALEQRYPEVLDTFKSGKLTDEATDVLKKLCAELSSQY